MPCSGCSALHGVNPDQKKMICSAARKVFHKIMQKLVFKQNSVIYQYSQPLAPGSLGPIIFQIRINTSGVKI